MTMQLSGSEFRRLRKAILETFPRQELRELVVFELGEDLDAIAGGTDHSEVVFNLLTWAKSQGRLSELVAVAYQERTHHAELSWFNQKLNPVTTPPSSAASNVAFQQFPEVFRFDLNPLIEKCLEELLEKKGLIGRP